MIAGGISSEMGKRYKEDRPLKFLLRKRNVIFFPCALFICFLSFPSSVLCSLRQCCSGTLLKDLFPCAIRLLPRSNMLSPSNQSTYLALWLFEEVGTYLNPYLHRKIQERAIIFSFMHQSAPQTFELLT